MHQDQPTPLDSKLNSTTRDACPLQLPSPNHSMLPASQLPDHSIDFPGRKRCSGVASLTKSASHIHKAVDALLVGHPDEGLACDRAHGARFGTKASTATQKRPQPAVAASGFDPFK
jgi:hypothetical protein